MIDIIEYLYEKKCVERKRNNLGTLRIAFFKFSFILLNKYS